MDEQRSIELLASGAKTGVSYRNLSAAGIPLVTESYFKSLLVAIYRHHIHELLSRARILLPPAEARLMMGVMDEKGVLQPGQVRKEPTNFFLKCFSNNNIICFCKALQLVVIGSK